MGPTRFRHGWKTKSQDPRTLIDGGSLRRLGESLPWSTEFARRVFDAEWLGVEDEPEMVTATIDDPDGSVVGFVQFVHGTAYVGVSWLPEAPDVLEELKVSFFLIKNESSDHPEAARTHVGYRLSLIHI